MFPGNHKTSKFWASYNAEHWIQQKLNLTFQQHRQAAYSVIWLYHSQLVLQIHPEHKYKLYLWCTPHQENLGPKIQYDV